MKVRLLPLAPPITIHLCQCSLTVERVNADFYIHVQQILNMSMRKPGHISTSVINKRYKRRLSSARRLKARRIAMLGVPRYARGLNDRIGIDQPL